ncbi:M15 family metallopeptidase [Microbacteriaceae bacterium]|nr:M15 family metallopeptidase [Candidatus Saccharibacteria bacterium]
MRTISNRSRRPAAQRNFWRQHLLVTLTLLGLSASCLVFIAYSNWSQQEQAKAATLKSAREIAHIDQQVKDTLNKRIEDAKKTEVDAKAKAFTAQSSFTTASQTADQHCGVSNPASVTVIINKKHCFDPKNWAPGHLVSIDGFILQSSAGEHLTTMMQAAANADAGFSLSSAYRSYDNQVVTYNNWVNINGSVAAADTVSARPGFSEHQTGLAADLKVSNCALGCFAGTRSYSWLQEHAAEYGFIERYPKGLAAITGYDPEAWHWRYVGAPTAIDMKEKGIQALETYFNVSGGDYN